MNADGAGHLGQPADRFLHLVACHHHEVCQLVDDDQDVRQWLRQFLALVLRRTPLVQHGPDVPVVLVDVPHPLSRERLVAFFHLAHGPPQGVGGLLGIDDHGGQQVGNILVHPQLEPLGVDHDQPHVVRGGAIEDAREHRVQANRLARARRARDEEVGHRGQVGHVGLAVDRLAKGERQLRGGPGVDVGLEQLPERDLLPLEVGNLDAHGGLAREPVDEDGLGFHREAEVLGQPGDLAVLDASVRLELERRDDRAGVDLNRLALHGELAAFLFEEARRVHQFALVHLALRARGVEQGKRGQREIAATSFGRGLDGGPGGQWQGRRGRHANRLAPPADVRRGLPGRPDRLCRRRDPDTALRLRPGGRLGRPLRPVHALLRVLAQDLAPLLLAGPLGTAVAPALPGAYDLQANRIGHRAEEPAERELRHHDDGQEERRHDEHHGSRAVEVGGQHRGDEVAGVATRPERPSSGPIQVVEGETEQRREAGEEQQSAGGLRVGRVERPAPEVVPPHDDQHDGQQVRAVPERLKREFRQEGPDPAREVLGGALGPGVEEPHRVGGGVARERDQHQHRGAEAREAEHFARTTGEGRAQHGC